MVGDDRDPKEKLLEAALAILEEEGDPERVTVRRLAERAGVSLGAVNYHFGSKDNLLNEAVVSVMQSAAGRWLGALPEPGEDPRERLLALLKETSAVAVRYPALSQVSMRHELLNGEMGVQQMILPLLRAIAGPQADERTLRLQAMALMVTLQIGGLRTEEFARFTGLDLTDDRQRDDAIERLVTMITGDE